MAFASCSLPLPPCPDEAVVEGKAARQGAGKNRVGSAGSRSKATLRRAFSCVQHSSSLCGSGVLKLFLTQKYHSEMHLIHQKTEETPFLKLHIPSSILGKL